MQKSIISLSVCSLIGMFSLSYATSASANSNVIYKDMALTAPAAPKPIFELALGALYLQPSGSNLDYAVLGHPLPVNSPHWGVESVNPSHSWGFDLSGRYFVPNTNYDVAASWDHLNTSDSDSTGVASDSGLFVVFPFQAGPSAGQSLNNPSQNAHSTVKFKYNAENLAVGKNIIFDTHMQVRLYAGLGAAQLKQNISTTFRDDANTFSINSTNNSKFNGVGPLFGIGSGYDFSNGLGVFGDLNIFELIGTLNPSTSFTSSSPELAASGIASNHQSISPNNSTQGVPGMKGKLGVSFSHSMGQESIFTAALGYEYATYLNAIATYNPDVVFGNVNTGTIALSSLGKTTSNYTVQGWFLNFGISMA